jgi:hypothetical protein
MGMKKAAIMAVFLAASFLLLSAGAGAGAGDQRVIGVQDCHTTKSRDVDEVESQRAMKMDQDYWDYLIFLPYQHSLICSASASLVRCGLSSVLPGAASVSYHALSGWRGFCFSNDPGHPRRSHRLGWRI